MAEEAKKEGVEMKKVDGDKKEPETSRPAPRKSATTSTPAADNGESGAKKRVSQVQYNKPGGVMPFYMILALIAAGLGGFVQKEFKNLQELEKDWDPTPRGLGKDQVKILFCHG